MTRPLRRARGAEAAVLALSVDRTATTSLAGQLAAQLRNFILSGRVTSGARLPSTRAMATELGIARSTAIQAVEQLVAEGYVEGRRGAGLFVSSLLPEHLLVPMASRRLPPPLILSAPSPVLPFTPEALDPDLFPHVIWARLLQRGWRAHGVALLRHSDPFGWLPLRAAIARHLRDWRGIDCDPACVVITAGMADATSLLASGLFQRGDRVVVEDPGYPVIAAELARSGLRAVPLRVDADGLDARQILADPSARRARGAFVAPARQHPLGGSMLLSRRLALLAWAREAEGVIVEDEYDGEYRYAGAPLPALMSLDRHGIVVHVGSFSKVLSRSLRLGYVVLPAGLAETVRSRLSYRVPLASIPVQPALAEFIASGELAAHVRRTRRIYARRLEALLDAARPWRGLLDVAPTDCGLHVIARFGPSMPRGTDDRAVTEAANGCGLVVRPLSASHVLMPRHQGLILGFAGFPESVLAGAMDRLGRVAAGMVSRSERGKSGAPNHSRPGTARRS